MNVLVNPLPVMSSHAARTSGSFSSQDKEPVAVTFCNLKRFQTLKRLCGGLNFLDLIGIEIFMFPDVLKIAHRFPTKQHQTNDK